ncbi:MAG TPA: P-loop NTPase fold protein, partial [Puia sp.]|nr:P-loop NTPase fold protein [Puia sp.]
MKKIIQKSLPGLIKFLERLQKKLTPINLIEDDKAYHALSPVRNADQVDEYIQALDWAIKRREENDILNIAITGPYGSGKSSILKTYIERHQDQGLHFLPISLATFKEDSTVAPVQDSANKPAGGENTSGKENLLRQIELSILQQIFYFEEDKKIPDSRFKKIRSVSQGELVMNSARIILLGLAVVGFFFLKPLFEQLHVTTSERLSTSIKWSSLLILTVGLCSIVYKSIRTITSVSISKLKLQNAEIEIGKNISKSALNNHLDEILYFFEVTSYNVVIIEDLDRFEQTEIFTKLREINQLINKSKKVNRKVAFIYAVKDEMFQDKDRTKFFDFIIPIIPVINSSNSSEKLKRIVSDYKYKISESLIDDIALFIDDMRLLYNVMNEYRVYQLKLGEKLDQEKLMGMVVYKNIHPRDFVDLANRTGFLYNIFGKYNDHINAYIANADTKIADLRKSMETLNRLQIRSIRELRMLYILNLYARLNEPNSLRLGGGRTFSLL